MVICALQSQFISQAFYQGADKEVMLRAVTRDWVAVEEYTVNKRVRLIQ